jgi:hypothetical protein
LKSPSSKTDDGNMENLSLFGSPHRAYTKMVWAAIEDPPPVKNMDTVDSIVRYGVQGEWIYIWFDACGAIKVWLRATKVPMEAAGSRGCLCECNKGAGIYRVAIV